MSINIQRTCSKKKHTGVDCEYGENRRFCLPESRTSGIEAPSPRSTFICPPEEGGLGRRGVTDEEASKELVLLAPDEL